MRAPSKVAFRQKLVIPGPERGCSPLRLKLSTIVQLSRQPLSAHIAALGDPAPECCAFCCPQAIEASAASQHCGIQPPRLQLVPAESPTAQLSPLVARHGPDNQCMSHHRNSSCELEVSRRMRYWSWRLHSPATMLELRPWPEARDLSAKVHHAHDGRRDAKSIHQVKKGVRLADTVQGA